MPHHSLFARDTGSQILGLPTSLALVILIAGPILVLGSTGVLIYYFVKSRRTRRERNRALSKSSQNTVSSGNDPEIAMTEQQFFQYSNVRAPQPQAGYGMPSQAHLEQYVNVPPPTQHDEFDRGQFERPRVQQEKELQFPTPPDTVPRPRTAPNHGRYSPPEHQSNYGQNMPPNFNPPVSPPRARSPSSSSDTAYSSTRAAQRQSRSLNKPVRPPHRPTHSPAGSVRSLSIFPPRHVPNQHPAQSPTPSQQGTASPGPLTPSPPLLSPLPVPLSPSSYSDPGGVRRHYRHPSIDRNSNMPIAPIIFPMGPIAQDHAVLPVLEEQNGFTEHEYQEPFQPRIWHDRSQPRDYI